MQTEDHGPKQAVFVTQVFLEGRIVHLERSSYRDALNADGEATPDELRIRMQEQHKDQLRRLVRGEFDRRIGDALEAPAESPSRTPPVDDATVLTVEAGDEGESSAFLEALDEEMARQQPLSPSLPSVAPPPARSPSAFGQPRAQALRKDPATGPRWEDGHPPADTLIDFGIPGSLREVLRARLKSPARALKSPLPAGVAPHPAGKSARARSASRSRVTDPADSPAPRPASSARRNGPGPSETPVNPEDFDGRETMLEVDAGALKREIEAQREQLRAIRRGTLPAPVGPEHPPRAWSLDDTFLNSLFDDE